MNKDLFLRGVKEIIDEKSFEAKLSSKRILRIKYGVDPTRPDIHLGHTVAMRRLKLLQDDGHTIIFLIGDYTAKIGDPSGRNSTRPVLTDDEIKQNAKTYLDQAGKILDISKTELRFNSEWFSKMSFSEILQLAGKFSVAQLIERDDFAKRLASNSALGLHEILYPVMQAHDSVELQADVEFGGSDQKFNMLAGRDLQKKVGQKPQDVVIVDLLVGLDGKIKMSKSADNYIGITENPQEIFGKIMSIPDDLILQYFELCTELASAEIKDIENKLAKGENPRDLKMRLAKEIIILFHTEGQATEAEKEFIRVFSRHELPNEIEEISIGGEEIEIINLVTEADSSISRSEAKRLIEQGAVKINDEKIIEIDKNVKISADMILRIGKLKVFRVKSR